MSSKFIIITVIILTVYILLNQSTNSPISPRQTPSPAISPTKAIRPPSGTAKGVVFLEQPSPKDKITSPLEVSGKVYSKKGKLTITLKQKESGLIVTEPKVVQIKGESDPIKFNASLQFGLPVKPQTGILEIDFKDESSKGADDKFSIEVEFPSDLGRSE